MAVLRSLGQVRDLIAWLLLVWPIYLIKRLQIFASASPNNWVNY